MDSLILAFSFAAAFAISASVVLIFAWSIDDALFRVIPREMAAAWSQFVKFGLFTVTLAGGMRLRELSQFLALGSPAGPAPTGGESLLEVFKSITAALIAGSGALLVFFCATLALYLSQRFLQEQRPAAGKAAALAPRAVGSERHAGGKERQRTEEAGRFL